MLTVLLATRNRATILRATLESFCALKPPPGDWKLVAVDNGSTDETSGVLRAFADRLPLCVTTETRPGKNIALNTGLNLVEGDLTVLTDDDIFPRADWLVQLRKAADAQEAFSMFGGVILPRWEAPPQRWIAGLDLGVVYSVTDPSLAEGPMPPILVFGGNMAIRTGIFAVGSRFDENIGPRSPQYAMGSESELLLRLGREGHRAWHVQNAVVEHFIRAEQLNRAWVLRRAVRYGRGRSRWSTNKKLWWGYPRHLVRDFPKEAGLIAVNWLFRRRDALFRARWRFNVLRGLASEAHLAAQKRLERTDSAISGH